MEHRPKPTTPVTSSPPRILHLASFDRWSGAAAPALAETEALRREGIEAHYGYVGGYLMEKKLEAIPWAHPVLVRGEGPLSVMRNIRAIRKLIDSHGFDIVHAHLSHDHWLARLAIGRRRPSGLVRTFHSRRSIKSDPFSRRLIAGTDAVAVVSPILAKSPVLLNREPLVTPAPVEPRHVPEGNSARATYGIPPEVPVIGVIGKVSPGRGFEDAIETFAVVRRARPDARMLIVGKGPHMPVLKQLADQLALGDSVIWAGYHEDDLPEHFRAMDVLVFTAAGSDEGHRAISEAGACGTPVAAYPLPGVAHVLGETADDLVSDESTPASLATVVARVLSGELPEIDKRSVENAARFDYAATAERLLTLYQRALHV